MKKIAAMFAFLVFSVFTVTYIFIVYFNTTVSYAVMADGTQIKVYNVPKNKNVPGEKIPVFFSNKFVYTYVKNAKPGTDSALIISDDVAKR